MLYECPGQLSCGIPTFGSGGTAFLWISLVAVAVVAVQATRLHTGELIDQTVELPGLVTWGDACSVHPRVQIQEDRDGMILGGGR